MNISFFTIPKAFTGRSAIHQDNAIAALLKLPNNPEVILCGNDPGVAEAAERFGVRYLPDICCTEKGTPLLDDAFAQAHAQSTGEILAYVNADILLLPDFIQAVEQIMQEHSQFLMLGRRWNLEVEQPIDFEVEQWQSHLSSRLHQYGTFSGIGALDYFVFPKPLFDRLPPFAVGRAGWDNWMVGEALKHDIPVVNVSQAVTVIHQNHDYGHLPGKRLEAFHGEEAKQNRVFLQNHFAGSSADATYTLRQQLSSPRVSVILALGKLNKKEPDRTAEVVQSLSQRQDYADFEIVVDDSEMLSVETSTVAQWNRGLMKAKGEFVLFLCPQSELLPGSLNAMMEKVDTRAGSLEMVLAGWQISTKIAADNQPTVVEPWHQLGKLLNGREGIQGFHAWSLPELLDLLHPSSVLIRRDWVERFGPLEEKQDVLDDRLCPQAAVIDLVLRLFSRGAAAVYLEEAMLQSYEQESSDNVSEVETTHQECSRILDRLFQQTHMPRWSRPLKRHAYDRIESWLAAPREGSGSDLSKASPQVL